jgi:MinD-like ATPase involved in chromosome partitioning or flagellar assembly
MTALQWIVKEAKKLKKEYPKRFSKWTDYVAQASAIYAKKHKEKSPVGKKKAKVSGVKKKAAKKKTSKPTEKTILNKIHKVKREVDKLDEAQHKHMSIGKIKSAGIGSLKHKYGIISAKKLTEKSKRNKAKLQKELKEIASKIKKLNTL